MQKKSTQQIIQQKKKKKSFCLLSKNFEEKVKHFKNAQKVIAAQQRQC